jgi:hypothetical protein
MMLEVGHLKNSWCSSFSQIVLFNFASLLSNKAACTCTSRGWSSELLAAGHCGWTWTSRAYCSDSCKIWYWSCQKFARIRWGLSSRNPSSPFPFASVQPDHCLHGYEWVTPKCAGLDHIGCIMIRDSSIKVLYDACLGLGSSVLLTGANLAVV